MTERTCPNCGAALTGEATYCMACGQRTGADRAPVPTWAIIVAILLLLLALALGAIGACFLLFGLQPVTSGGDEWGMVAVGGGLLLGALVFTVVAILLLRRRKRKVES